MIRIGLLRLSAETEAAKRLFWNPWIFYWLGLFADKN